MKRMGWFGVFGFFGIFLGCLGHSGFELGGTTALAAPTADRANCTSVLEEGALDFRLIGESVGDPLTALLKVKREFAFLSSIQKAQTNSPYVGAFEESLALIRNTIKFAFTDSQRWLDLVTEVEDGLNQRNGLSFEVLQKQQQTIILVQTKKAAALPRISIPLIGDFSNKSREEIKAAAQSRFIDAIALALTSETILRTLNSSMKEEIDGSMSLAQWFHSFEKLLNNDTILPLNNLDVPMPVSQEALQTDEHYSELQKIAAEMDELSQNLSQAAGAGLPASKALEKLLLLNGMAFRVLPTIQSLKGQGVFLSLVAEDFSELEIQKLESFKVIHRYATNLQEVVIHLILRSRTLSVERDERYLNAGLKGLASVLRLGARLEAGAPPVFDVELSRQYIETFSGFWLSHTSETVPVHQIGLEQMLYAVSAIEAVQATGMPAIVINKVQGDGQAFARLHYGDGTQVEVLRRGTALRAVSPDSVQGPESGHPFRINSINALPDGHSAILVDTYEQRDGTVHSIQRTLQPDEWAAHHFSRSDSAGVEIDAFARSHTEQQPLELRRNASKNQAN